MAKTCLLIVYTSRCLSLEVPSVHLKTAYMCEAFYDLFVCYKYAVYKFTECISRHMQANFLDRVVFS